MSEGHIHDWEDVTVVWKDNHDDNWQRDVSLIYQCPSDIKKITILNLRSLYFFLSTAGEHILAGGTCKPLTGSKSFLLA